MWTGSVVALTFTIGSLLLFIHIVIAFWSVASELFSLKQGLAISALTGCIPNDL
jgi:hypothetical protein